MELERFIQICEEIVPDERGCRNWPLGKTSAGYPQLKLGLHHAYGHRLALELKLGRRIAPGMRALHECDNPGCVEQSHLMEGTQKKNIEDCLSRGRFITGDKNGSRTQPGRRPRGQENGMSKLTEEQVLQIIQLRKEGLTQHAIAERFGMHQWGVWCILNGRTWSHITGITRKPRWTEHG